MNCTFVAFTVLLLSTQIWEENLNCELKVCLQPDGYRALVSTLWWTQKIEIKKHPQRETRVIQGASVLCTHKKILISFLPLAAQLIWSNNGINCASELSVHLLTEARRSAETFQNHAGCFSNQSWYYNVCFFFCLQKKKMCVNQRASGWRWRHKALIGYCKKKKTDCVC